MYAIHRVISQGLFCIEHVCDITKERRIIFQSNNEVETMRRFKRLKELRDYEMGLWRQFWRKG